MRQVLPRGVTRTQVDSSATAILRALACSNPICQCNASLGRDRGLTHCPAHDDRTPSLNVQTGDDGTTLLKCHAGCENSAVILALTERGLWGTGHAEPAIERRARGQVVAQYKYQKADGSHAYTIFRDEFKNFWVSPAGLTDKDKVLYHLPEVIAAIERKEKVYVCEGEKDADNLRAQGVTATCNPFGAGKWLEEYSQHLIGAEVVILADKDEPGRAHAREVAQRCSVAARSIRIIELPGSGKDASDWLAAGGNKLALEVLVDDAPEWEASEKVIYSARDLAKEHREVVERRIAGDPDYVGWMTGFRSLDKEMRYAPGDFWMIAASTSSGKSAMLHSLQRRCLVPSLLFSVEMSRMQVVDRLIAAEAKVDSWKIRRGDLSYDERKRVADAQDRFQTTDIQIVDRSPMTTKSIESIVRVASARGTRIIYLDYIGLLVDRGGDSRYEKVTNIAHDLMGIAKSANVGLVVASQVNRKGDRKSGEPPFMEEMRDSGVIEEDAAVVLAIGRAEGSSDAKLAVRKNRHGLVGFTIPLVFDPQLTEFVEVSEARRDRASTEVPF